MSHLTSTKARVAIVTVRDDGVRTVLLTEHWAGTYVDARVHIARYIASNGLTRDAFGDAEKLYHNGVQIGHYTITRS
jgi:hypothetical protein